MRPTIPTPLAKVAREATCRVCGHPIWRVDVKNKEQRGQWVHASEYGDNPPGSLPR